MVAPVGLLAFFRAIADLPAPNAILHFRIAGCFTPHTVLARLEFGHVGVFEGGQEIAAFPGGVEDHPGLCQKGNSQIELSDWSIPTEPL